MAGRRAPGRRARAGGPARVGPGRRASSATPSAAAWRGSAVATGWRQLGDGLEVVTADGEAGARPTRRPSPTSSGPSAGAAATSASSRRWSSASTRSSPERRLAHLALGGGAACAGAVGRVDPTRCPSEVTSVGRLLQLPPLPGSARGLRGRQLAVIEAAILADEEEAGRLLAPCASSVRSSTRSPRCRRRACPAAHGPARAGSGVGNGCIIDACRRRRSTPWWPSRGPGRAPPRSRSSPARRRRARARPAGAGALGRHRRRLPGFGAGMLMPPGAGPRCRATRGRGRQRGHARWGAGRSLLELRRRRRPTRRPCSIREAYRRLREIRGRIDPEGLLLANHPIPAA